MLNPSTIVPGKNVSLVINRTKGTGAKSMGSTRRNGNAYRIVINEERCQEMLDGSWLKGRMTIDQWMFGVSLHEFAHIRYDSFKGIRSEATKLWNWIDNVIEDMRVEYRMAIEFPTYAQYFGYVLSGVKDSWDGTTSDELSKNLDRLFKMARFGIVDDSPFCSFALPILLSARRRTTRNNSVVASNAIYSYLEDDSTKDKGDDALSHKQEPVTKEDIEEALDSEDQVMQTGASGQAEKAKEQENDGEDEQLSLGMLPGIGNTELQLESNDNTFVKQVESDHRVVISKLRAVFKTMIDTPSWKKTYEGELNIMRQQEALMDSFSGESGENFEQFTRKTEDLDVVVIRDVSYSTSGVKEEYAESLAVILLAVDGMKTVRSASIDFSDDAIVTKTFSENMIASRIGPRVKDGTQLSYVRPEMNKMSWKARNKFVFVLTDGQLIPGDELYFEELRNEGKKVFVMNVGGAHNQNADTVQISKIPEYVAKKVKSNYA